MRDTIVYRGPNEEGIHVEKNAGIAICGLIVINLETGRQPISNENKILWIVCIIYVALLLLLYGMRTEESYFLWSISVNR